MPKIHMQRHMRHTPDDMLVLVAEVQNYPNFIDLISAVRVISHDTLSPNKEKFIADVGITYKIISEQFRSQVIVDRDAKTLRIEKSGHGGALRELQNDWQFILLKDGSTLIDFRLNVRLKAPPLEFLIKQKIGKAARHVMNAFEKQAAKTCECVGASDYDFRAEAQTLSAKRFV